MWTLILMGLIATTTCFPLEDLEELTQIPTTTDNMEPEQSVVSYVQNFQHVMVKFVNHKYNNLTEHDMEKIRNTLQEFLIKFANDLKETVQAQQNNAMLEIEQEIQDGLPEATFIEIEDRMKSEFPDINDQTARIIVFKLRRNLYITRQKIDAIIKSTNKEFENVEA